MVHYSLVSIIIYHQRALLFYVYYSALRMPIVFYLFAAFVIFCMNFALYADPDFLVCFGFNIKISSVLYLFVFCIMIYALMGF